eukprot:Hpha_TRINITY_DN28108_c0_g1::TRINITY_DN28108_c0_g1_i1::g.103246::m.103246/K06269/PPP1C; serine/threonine-protein phosphatase PP1 catalytic subunit
MAADAYLDAIIQKLLDVKGRRSVTVSSLTQTEMSWLAKQSGQIIMGQPALLQLSAPLRVVGDIHGHYEDLLRVFEHCGYPSDSRYLFLGNYVDRGSHSIETLALLLAFKIKFPEKVFLLRGNHECKAMTRIYGFQKDCKRRFNIQTWRNINEDVFDCLPFAAVIDDKIFCAHGGLSPALTDPSTPGGHDLNQIAEVQRPMDAPESGLVCDLLWADPAPHVQGWKEGNDRGVSYKFGPDVVENFLQQYNLDLIVRSHEVVEDGFEFFAERKLVTLFTASRHSGAENAGAVMNIDASLLCSFQVLA